MKLPIPCHLLLGASGAGKSRLLLALLRRKPEGERWVFFVNDAGRTQLPGTGGGGSGSGSGSGDAPPPPPAAPEGLVVREMGGGCVCCTLAGPLSAGLAQARARLPPAAAAAVVRSLFAPTRLSARRLTAASHPLPPLPPIVVANAKKNRSSARRSPTDCSSRRRARRTRRRCSRRWAGRTLGRRSRSRPSSACWTPAAAATTTPCFPPPRRWRTS
jgi:hypothetical protein